MKMPRVITDWTVFENWIKKEDFTAHLRDGGRDGGRDGVVYWDFRLGHANCPHEIRIKVHANGWVGVYFSRDMAVGENKDVDRPEHISTFVNLLDRGGFKKCEGEKKWGKDKVLLEKKGNLTFILSYSNGDSRDKYPQYQYGACIELAKLIEELYGTKKAT